ncbi:MAG TPA: cobyrinate a,c-diamide synthase [bacterium]|nr:cobyrinate a,c-diamide synthase [bacterium]
MTISALVIAGTQSGTGKTTISLGVARALRDAGLRVQPFKVGPDFLDPTHLARAAGRTCYNLDPWMTSDDYCRRLVATRAADATLALVEGVMGLFDGAAPGALAGSTAAVAQLLAAPVLLVVDAAGMAGSIAAMVQGYCTFAPGVNIAGVIANRVGSPGHTVLLAQALAAAGLPPLLGGIPAGALPVLPERHLGLVTGEALPEPVVAAAAAAVREYLDLGGMRARAASGVTAAAPPAPCKGRRWRLGLARDAAFSFYYPDNLELLQEAGAELCAFSPLADDQLPEALDALYLGGGYPECHARALAANTAMLAAVRTLAASGRPLLAECGGLLYLGEELTDADGTGQRLCGVIPVAARMLDRLRCLGYRATEFLADTPLGPRGLGLRGHEFHYSEIVRDEVAAAGWRPAFAMRTARGDDAGTGGYARGNVLAGYVHWHFGAQPAAVAALAAAACR